MQNTERLRKDAIAIFRRYLAQVSTVGSHLVIQLYLQVMQGARGKEQRARSKGQGTLFEPPTA
jgi:hypothetical protein